MSSSEEMIDAQLFMANALADDMPNADPDAFMECVAVAAEGLVAAINSVKFHRIIESNGLTIED